MQLDLFCLCESALVNQTGHITVNAIFDTLISRPGVPVGTFQVATLIRVFRGQDEGRHAVKVYLQNEVGKMLRPPIEDVVMLSELTRDSLQMFRTYQVPPLPWECGKYLFAIEISGRQIATTPLYMVPPQLNRPFPR